MVTTFSIIVIPVTVQVVCLPVKTDSVILTCKECYFAQLMAANESRTAEYGYDASLTVNAQQLDCSHLYEKVSVCM